VNDVSAIEPIVSQKPKRSSDAAFGRLFGSILIAYAAWPMLHLEHPGYVALGAGVALLLVSRFVPAVLGPFNAAWIKLGDLLHRIVSPVLMSLIYVLSVIPTGIIVRLMGKDLLRLKRDDSEASYWIVRTPAGPSPQSMKQQF
jgi:hypothetical protein